MQELQKAFIDFFDPAASDNRPANLKGQTAYS
jgi:hypothetical protein